MQSSDIVRLNQGDRVHFTVSPVMFPGGGQVLLDPRGKPEGVELEVRWFDAEYLHWKEPQLITAGPFVALAPPGGGRWVAVVSVTE